MTQIWKPQSPDIHRYWLDTILEEASDKLTKWESNFLVGIEKALDFGWILSEAQEATLEKIYAEKTP